MTPEFFGLNLTVEIKGRKKSTKQKPLAQPCGSRGPRTAGLPAQGGMRLVEKAQGAQAWPRPGAPVGLEHPLTWTQIKDTLELPDAQQYTENTCRVDTAAARSWRRHTGESQGCSGRSPPLKASRATAGSQGS
ncbi:Transient Receptor Potential Cation Channel Subfamily V Member 6 [Manis pentadactyla]|nr:Transient Receptor Potential Cation Channel Subfamily V Member 6 [Manis pentadactyla]